MQLSLFTLSAVLACPHADLVKRDEVPAVRGSAVSQVDRVWQNILAKNNTQNPYITNPFKFLWKAETLNVHQSVEVDSEELPKGHGPIKLVHSAGVIAKAVLESTNDHPYTGIFKGAENMMIRLSCATPIQDAEEIVASIAFKFFRDNKPTTNFMGMYSTTAYPSYNYFENDLSTHIPGTNLTFGAKLINKRFKETTEWSAKVGVSDAARYNVDGSKVEKPDYPFQLLFRSKLSTRQRNEGKNDLFDQLAAIPAGTTLYEIYAKASPEAPFKKIGQVKSTTALVKSITGDQLFFKHQLFDEDLADKKEWLKGCPDPDHCEPCNVLKTCTFA